MYKYHERILDIRDLMLVIHTLVGTTCDWLDIRCALRNHNLNGRKRQTMIQPKKNPKFFFRSLVLLLQKPKKRLRIPKKSFWKTETLTSWCQITYFLPTPFVKDYPSQLTNKTFWKGFKPPTSDVFWMRLTLLFAAFGTLGCLLLFSPCQDAVEMFSFYLEPFYRTFFGGKAWDVICLFSMLLQHCFVSGVDFISTKQACMFVFVDWFICIDLPSNKV